MRTFFVFIILITLASGNTIIHGMEQQPADAEKKDCKSETDELAQEREIKETNQRIASLEEKVNKWQKKIKQACIDKETLRKHVANIGGIKYPTIKYYWHGGQRHYNEYPEGTILLKNRCTLTFQYNTGSEEKTVEKVIENGVESLTFREETTEVNKSNGHTPLIPNSLYPLIIFHYYTSLINYKTYLMQQADEKTIQISNREHAMPNTITSISLSSGTKDDNVEIGYENNGTDGIYTTPLKEHKEFLPERRPGGGSGRMKYLFL